MIKLENVSVQTAVDFDGVGMTHTLSGQDFDLEMEDVISPWVLVKSKSGEALGLIPANNIRRVRFFTEQGKARLAKAKGQQPKAQAQQQGNGKEQQAR